MFIWLLVFGMVISFYRPFSEWPVVGEHTTLIVRTYIWSLIAIWLIGWLANPNAKRLPENILFLAIFLYTLVAIISALVSPYYTSIFENMVLLGWIEHIVLFVIIVTSVKTEKDLKIILTFLAAALFVDMSHTFWNYLSGYVRYTRGVERIDGGRGLYATQLLYLLPFMLPLVTLCKKYWHYLFAVGYVLLTLRLVTLTASRTSFITLIGLLVLFMLLSRYRFRIFPVLFLVLPLGWLLMPEGMQNRYRTLWDSTIDHTANLTAEARVNAFSTGLENWLNHPIVGVGPGAHGRPSGSGYEAHNLYAQVIGELGTVGIVSFLFILVCFGINHYHIWKNYKYLQEKKLDKERLYCWRVSIAVMYGVLVMLIGGFGMHHAFTYFWLWLAAFQILAAVLMQDTVTAVKQGKLLPSLLSMPVCRCRGNFLA